MKLTYKASQPQEIVRIFCPECGERVRNVGLIPDDCSVKGLSIRCKRCHRYIEIEATTEKSK